MKHRMSKIRLRVTSVGGLTLVALVALTGCGGGSGSSDGANKASPTSYQPRSSSVANGDGPAPPIAAGVTAAARAAGCQVKPFPSEGRGHVEDTPDYRQSRPPTSGPHNPIWADWGIYDSPVPEKFQVHNLEHGGVIVHVGPRVAEPARQGLIGLWRENPAYLLVVPGDGPSFPPDAVVATSWQRWIVCKPYTEAARTAIVAFADEYRGAGPEPVPALNGEPGGAQGRPSPSIPDDGASR